MPAMTWCWPDIFTAASWSPVNIETVCFRARSSTRIAFSVITVVRHGWWSVAGSVTSYRFAGGVLEKLCSAMSDRHPTPRHPVRAGRMRASLVSVACFLRGLPFFFCATPRTPLRVLGLIALDTLHVLRHSQPLPRKRIRELALFLDFQGCTNAAWDHKDVSAADCQAIRSQLEEVGLKLCVAEYLSRLRELERRRPSIGGDHRRFAEVRSYREAVARLSLGTAAAIALHAECLDEGIRATQCDCDVETLFRVLMQCQVIDDVLDYTEDLAAGLPSFLTASASLPQAMEWTASAARDYAASAARSPGTGVFPLRMALCVFTAVTKLVVRVADRRHRNARRLAHQRSIH